MKELNLYPSRVSNQITESYYYTLIEQISNGTCSLRVSKVLRKNGKCQYFTYHLTSIM